MNPNKVVGPTPDLELDAWIEPFEAAAASGSIPDLSEYLPDSLHPMYTAVLRELIRVDLEYAWACGEERHVEDYIERFPGLVDDQSMLAEIALEEYRQRRAAGESPPSGEYYRRLGIDLPLESGVQPPAGPAWEGRGFPNIGDTVGPGYRILSELGRGAFGRVYLAEQKDLANRKVAIKISSRLIGEAQTLARLQHTHIVPIYSVHRVGSFQVLVMPYLGSTTLANVLASVRVGASGRVTERTLRTAIAIQPGQPSALDPRPHRRPHRNRR